MKRFFRQARLRRRRRRAHSHGAGGSRSRSEPAAARRRRPHSTESEKKKKKVGLSKIKNPENFFSLLSFIAPQSLPVSRRRYANEESQSPRRSCCPLCPASISARERQGAQGGFAPHGLDFFLVGCLENNLIFSRRQVSNCSRSFSSLASASLSPFDTQTTQPYPKCRLVGGS